MKKIIVLLITLQTFLFNLHCFAQMGEWTWMKGDSTVCYCSLAHYGTQGVFDSLNTPPALYEAYEWTDLNGNFWLFGGSDQDSAGQNFYSDLWEFKPFVNQWAWIKGPGIPNQNGIYGIQGIPSDTNNPGARCSSPTWVDLSGNLWLFGGAGMALNGPHGGLNDLWEYNIATNEWTWMSGPDTANGFGHYGTLMISSPANNPPAKDETNGSWVDSIGNLWLFGGNFFGHPISDLWKYDVSINQWTWMNGPDSINQPPVYGIEGIPDSANHPGARFVYTKWKDSNGNFWLYGSGRNDLWRYNPATNEWTWMSGSNQVNSQGISGTQCIGNTMNIPSPRFENRTCWKLSCDNFVIFGGSSNNYESFYNDIWNYSVSTNEWTWMSGSVTNPYGHYGSITVSSPDNIPHGRCGSIGWKDNSGNLWMFGGTSDTTINFTLHEIFYNDMWRFVPDTTCPYLCNQTTGVKEIAMVNHIIDIYPNPAQDNLTIKILAKNKISMKIEDVTGRVLNTYEFDNEVLTGTIDISNLDNGLFFVVALDDKNNYIQRTKFVKIK
jgi:type IX secretion system substrate protein/galactose oxidase-like protein